MKGLFITFEGNDGSGKSSVIETIKKELMNRGYDVLYSREPGGSKIAEKIREVILDVDNVGMDDKTESLLYAASRREHIVKTLLPALKLSFAIDIWILRLLIKDMQGELVLMKYII